MALSVHYVRYLHHISLSCVNYETIFNEILQKIVRMHARSVPGRIFGPEYKANYVHTCNASCNIHLNCLCQEPGWCQRRRIVICMGTRPCTWLSCACYVTELPSCRLAHAATAIWGSVQGSSLWIVGWDLDLPKVNRCG